MTNVTGKPTLPEEKLARILFVGRVLPDGDVPVDETELLMDSLNTIELVNAVEDELKIVIGNEKFPKETPKTYGELKRVLGDMGVTVV
jgi:acyl carrier protein